MNNYKYNNNNNNNKLYLSVRYLNYEWRLNFNCLSANEQIDQLSFSISKHSWERPVTRSSWRRFRDSIHKIDSKNKTTLMSALEIADFTCLRRAMDERI